MASLEGPPSRARPHPWCREWRTLDRGLGQAEESVKAHTRPKTFQPGLVGWGVLEQNVWLERKATNSSPLGAAPVLPLSCPCSLGWGHSLSVLALLSPSPESSPPRSPCGSLLHLPETFIQMSPSALLFLIPPSASHLHHRSLLVSLSPVEHKLHLGRSVHLSCVLLSPQSLACNRSSVKFC